MSTSGLHSKFSKAKIDGGSVQIKSSTGRFTRSFVFASGVYRINPLKFAKSRSLICDSDHCPLEHFQIFVIFSENTSGVFFFSLQHFSGIRFCLIFKFISFYFVCRLQIEDVASAIKNYDRYLALNVRIGFL